MPFGYLFYHEKLGYREIKEAADLRKKIKVHVKTLAPFLQSIRVVVIAALAINTR